MRANDRKSRQTAHVAGTPTAPRLLHQGSLSDTKQKTGKSVLD
jgi:hypothetical protein